MNSETSTTRVAGAARRGRQRWWLAGAALGAFAVGLTIGLLQIHLRDHGSVRSAHVASSGVTVPGTSASAIAPRPRGGVADTIDLGGATGATPAGGPVNDAVLQAHLRQEETAAAGATATAAPTTFPLEAFPNGCPCDVPSMTAALPELTVYLVASEEQATAIQEALNERDALAATNGAQPLNAAVVVASDDTSESALQSEYPQYHVSVVDLRQQ